MPADVIDLLSSPEFPCSPVLPPPKKRARTPTRPSRPPAARKLVADDLVDLTEDSPPPAVPIFEDDFDTTIELSYVAATDSDERAAKRKRSPGLAEPARGEPSGQRSLGRSLSSVVGPSVRQPGARRTASAFDPIQTSSPDVRRVKDKGKGRASIYGFDDPFASSSPQVTTNAKGKTTAAKPTAKSIDFVDAFASSSPQVAATNTRGETVPKPSAKSVDFVDAFASTPPRPLGECSNSVPHRSPKKSTEWDPISSSAPERDTFTRSSPLPPPQPTGRQLAKSKSEVIDLLSSDSAVMASDDSIPDISDLSKIKARLDATYPAVGKGRNKPRTTARPAGVEKPKTTRTDPVEKAQARADKAAAREAEKERKKQEREQAKRDKERAAALAEVNKIRTDKKLSTPEMIVDLPQGLDETIKLHVETLFETLKVECTTKRSPVDGVDIVRWRRNVNSIYNEEAGQWEPVMPRIEDTEDYVMILMPAAKFVELAQGGTREGPPEGSDAGGTLQDHVQRVQAQFPTRKLIYLIEGMVRWMRNNRNIRNRQFTSAVRDLAPAAGAEAPPPPTSSQARRRRKNPPKPPPPQYVDEDVVEDALLELQVAHGALIHHTAVAVETAQWVAVFTQHISTVPYRRARDGANDAAFCMDSGQVRTGEGAEDTYVRMLQEVARVTAPIAYGVAAEHGSVSKLVRGFEEEGALLLEGVRKSANKDGAFSDRAVGQAVSRRLCKVFTGRDDASTDV